jgi:hypothetical protein
MATGLAQAQEYEGKGRRKIKIVIKMKNIVDNCEVTVYDHRASNQQTIRANGTETLLNQEYEPVMAERGPSGQRRERPERM